MGPKTDARLRPLGALGMANTDRGACSLAVVERGNVNLGTTYWRCDTGDS